MRRWNARNDSHRVKKQAGAHQGATGGVADLVALVAATVAPVGQAGGRPAEGAQQRVQDMGHAP